MRIYYFIITLIISFCVSLQAQNNADKFKQQAQSSFENKDYTKARYLYIQAYKDYANEGKITQAIECGTQAASLYHRENYYQEAFDLCRQMSQIVANQEHAEQKKLYGLRFGITKERLQMYIKLRNTAQAQLQLNMLDNLAEESGNPELTEELLYTKTDYFYIFEQKKEGDAAFNKLISQYREKKEYGKIDECYQNLIAIARKANNISLLEQTYEKYMVWTDSVKMLTAEDKLGALQQKYDSSLQTILEKEDQLSAKQYIIAGLCTLAAILIAPEPEVEEDHPDHHRAQRTTDRIHPKYIGADGTDTRRNEQIGSRIANHSTQTSKSHTSPYRCPKTVRKSYTRTFFVGKLLAGNLRSTIF